MLAAARVLAWLCVCSFQRPGWRLISFVPTANTVHTHAHVSMLPCRQRLPLLFLRGLFGTCAITCSYIALLNLPLGDAGVGQRRTGCRQRCRRLSCGLASFSKPCTPMPVFFTCFPPASLRTYPYLLPMHTHVLICAHTHACTRSDPCAAAAASHGCYGCPAAW